MSSARLTAAPPSAVPTARQLTAIVGVLSLAVFMSSLDLFIVNLAFPYIGREYAGTSLSNLSWVLNGYTIVFAAVLVPAGRWADRVGRRRLFVAGMIAFSFGSLLCGVAPGVAALIAARVIQAAGAGLMVPASLSLLLAAVPAPARGRAIGTWSALGALGAALGPVIGGSLVQISWRWVFWINLPVGLAAVLLAARVIPESKDEHVRGRPDLLGAALLAAAVGLLALALVKAPSWGWGSGGFIALLLGSLACGAAMVARSKRHHSPVIELALLRSRTFSGTFAASILYYAGFGAFVLNSVEFLTGEWHYSAVRAGLAIGPGPLMVLPFARLVAPRLAGLIGGAGRVAAVGCLVNAAAMSLWLSQIQAHPAYLTHLLPAQLLGGAGVGLTIPSLLAAGSASLPPDRFGTGSGVLNMGRQVGTVLGVAGLVAILAHVDRTDPLVSYEHGLVLIIAFFVGAGAVAASLLSARIPGPARPASAVPASVVPARTASAVPARPASVVPDRAASVVPGPPGASRSRDRR
jgi:EmrB/QacA subfamily drug resistance transporter